MSKELIEELRANAAALDGDLPGLLMLAADALEAKAAPVGEREAFEAWAASVGYHTERDMFQREKYQSSLTWELWRVWQAGAAYQRAQQPQSAEAVAFQKPSVLKDCNVRYSISTTPQPSAGVVMPEIPYQWSKSLTHCWPDDKDDRDGDWCVGCIDEEGNFYEVVKVEASQYDAGGESQKIAEAIVALWEFARLNKGAGSHE